MKNPSSLPDAGSPVRCLSRPGTLRAVGCLFAFFRRQGNEALALAGVAAVAGDLRFRPGMGATANPKIFLPSMIRSPSNGLTICLVTAVLACCRTKYATCRQLDAAPRDAFGRLDSGK
jgi:hypothetical protein